MKILFIKSTIKDFNYQKIITKINNEVISKKIQFLSISFEPNTIFKCEKAYRDFINQLTLIANTLNVYIITSSYRLIYHSFDMQAAVVIDNNGIVLDEVIKKYSEIDINHTEKYSVYNTPFGSFAVILGSDLWTIEIPRMLAIKNAEIIFVNDIASNEYNLNINVIRGIAVLNCINLIYRKVDMKEDTLIIHTPNKTLCNEKINESYSININMDDIKKLRKTDLSFKNTLWWLLSGRKPEIYKEILNDFF